MKKHKTIKKLISILLTVALINTSIPVKTVEATFLSDLLGGLFTIISAPIWIFCKDNPTFRKNNPFRKKPWQEEQDKLEIDKNEIDKNLRLSSRDLSYTSTTSTPKYKEPPIDISANADDASSPLKFTPKKHKRDLPLDILDIEEVNNNVNKKKNDKNSCNTSSSAGAEKYSGYYDTDILSVGPVENTNTSTNEFTKENNIKEEYSYYEDPNYYEDPDLPVEVILPVEVK